MNISPVEFFSALANDTRLRCLMLLMRHDEFCVCELTYAIGAAQPHISRHLAQLRELGLVSDRREGLWIYYPFATLLSLVPLGAATLLLGRVAGDLGFSSNYPVALLCIVAGLHLLDWMPPLPWSGRGLPRAVSRGPGTAHWLGMVFGLALGPCAFARIAPLLGVAWMQAAEGVAMPVLLLALFAAGHCAGVLLAASSIDRVQRWLDAFGKGHSITLGRAACGSLLLVGAGALIAGEN